MKNKVNCSISSDQRDILVFTMKQGKRPFLKIKTEKILFSILPPMKELEKILSKRNLAINIMSYELEKFLSTNVNLNNSNSAPIKIGYAKIGFKTILSILSLIDTFLSELIFVHLDNISSNFLYV